MAANPCKAMRIVLLGKTGVGKSACGNRIMKYEAFMSECSLVSVTKTCQSSESNVHGLNISVIDTPGVFDTDMKEDDLRREVGRCIDLSVPGPHAFLLVISLEGKFTKEERDVLEWIKKNFGEEALTYTLILFTHVDATGGKSLEDYIKDSTEIGAVISRCGGRYHGFNTNGGDNNEVLELLNKLKQMVVKNGGSHYTSKVYQEAQKRLDREKLKEKALVGVGVVGTAAVVAGATAIAAAGSVVIAPIVLVGGAIAALGTVAAVASKKIKEKRDKTGLSVSTER